MRRSFLPAHLLLALFLTIGLAPPAAAIDDDAAFSDDEPIAEEFVVDASLAVPAFDNDATTTAQTGSISLSWHSTHGTDITSAYMFEIQEARDSLFAETEVYYKGPDLATYVSGLASGHYYYRVREWFDSTQVSGWSDPVEVVVEHHSLGTAWLLFTVGGVVFLLTAGVVIHGAREQDGIDDQPSKKERG